MQNLTHRKIQSFLRRFIPARKLLFLVPILSFAAIALALTQARLIQNEIERSISDSADELDIKNRVEFSREVLTPRHSPHVSFIQRRADFSDIAEFRGSMFAATTSGLVELTNDGEFVRRLNVAHGLPESELTALAVFAGELFIGTKASGLVAFNGERFTAVRLKKPNAANITMLFADSRTLLVGTIQGGLLEFDGKHFSELKFEDKPINHAVAIERNGPRILVGTFADGLFVRRADYSWRRFTTADGLFSNRVVAVAVRQNEIFAACDLGVSRGRTDELEIDDASAFTRLFALPNLNGMTGAEDKLYLTTLPGELHMLRPEVSATAPFKTSTGVVNARLDRLGERLVVFGRGGASTIDNNAGEINLAALFRPLEKELSDGTISAIAADADGNIWLGLFRGGADIVTPDGKLLSHLETDEFRAINFLRPDDDDMLSGAAGGAFRIGRDRVPEKVGKSVSEPRPSAVNYVSATKNETGAFTAIASTSGLLLENADKRREFSTLNGLQSNSVFAVAFAGKTVYAATMSGLAIIENDRVGQVLTSSNSLLRNNWITALFSANGRIFGGTYGGGVFEITNGREIVPLTTAGEKLTVNPNALFADRERLYAGTLEGLAVFDFASGKWSTIGDLLPTATVLAVSGDDESIYLGTTAGAVRIDKRFWQPE